MMASAQSVVSLDANDAFPPDSLVDVNATTDLTLGCGPYALSSIAVYAPLTVHVTEPTVLMVEGDLIIEAPLVIDVADGASLDLVVGGDVNVNNTFTLGDAASPTTTWLAVGGALNVAAPLNVRGSLFVGGDVEANNTVVVSGAAYLGPLHVAAPVQIGGGTTPQPGFAGDGCFSPP